MKKGMGPPTGTWAIWNGVNDFMRSGFGVVEDGSVKRDEVFQGGFEQLGFVFGEISGGFVFQHPEGIDHGFRGTEIHRFLAVHGIWDLTEKKAGVLRLEQDKFVEARIGFGRTWHGLRIGSPGAGSKFGKTTGQKWNA
jgi:hypothetical protein